MSQMSLRLHWPSVAATVAFGAVATVAYQTANRFWREHRGAPADGAGSHPAIATSAAASAGSVSSSASCIVAAAERALESRPQAGASSNGASSVGAPLLDYLLMAGRCKVEKRTGWVNSGVPLAESVADHQWRMALMTLSCANYAALPMAECTCGAADAEADPERVWPARAVRMALVHDLAESLVSDITPTEFSGVTKAEKHRLESAAMQRIVDALTLAHQAARVSAAAASSASSDAATALAALSSHDVAEEILSLWEEYECGETATAQYVKLIDKVEMYLQAHEYQQTTAESTNEESKRVHQQLQRFFDGMPATREKAIDAEQPLLVALIDELQTRRSK